MIDGMMAVIRRLAHNRQELTAEEEADLVKMKQAACALRELSKPEERPRPREGAGEDAEARDRETHATGAMATEDFNAKRKSPTGIDDDEEVSQAKKVAQALTPSPLTLPERNSGRRERDSWGRDQNKKLRTM